MKDMSCPFSVTEKSKVTGKTYVRPCGSCTFCRINKRTQWEFRIFTEVMKEYRKGNYSTFATLTYNDNFVPYTEKGNQTISRQDIDNFIYRFNYNTKKLDGRNYKQFLVTEYGDTFGRPHAHSIIMGLDPCKRNLISASWLRGHVMALPVLSGAIRYVLKYMDKQIFGEQVKEVFQERTPPFTKKSHGIGLDYIKENYGALTADYGYVYKGHFFNLSPYMRSYLQNLDDSLYEYNNNFKLNPKIKKQALERGLTYKQEDFRNSVFNELLTLKSSLDKDGVADHKELDYLLNELNLCTPKQIKPSFNLYKVALEALEA